MGRQARSPDHLEQDSSLRPCRGVIVGNWQRRDFASHQVGDFARERVVSALQER